MDYRIQKNASSNAHLKNCMKERCRRECAATQHKSASVSGAHSCAFFPFSPSSSLAPSKGQQQLYAGDKRVRRWALGCDRLAQLLRWCEDYRLRLSKGHSARGCHLVTSLLQMTVWLATYTHSAINASVRRVLSGLRTSCTRSPPHISKSLIQCGNITGSLIINVFVCF